MSCTIAVAGKGGTGKTTICGFLIDWLCAAGKGPVLAVDADANSNLNEVLGVQADVTLGQIREEIAAADVPAAMSKQDYMDCRFTDALIEQDDFDMLVMGRTQGKGCYCFVNGLLQTAMSKYAGGYKHIVVDNEAGMEHISRGILPGVDYFLLVSDCSRRGIQAAGRMKGRLDAGIREEIALQKLDLLGVVPYDDMVYDYDSQGKPTSKLPDKSKARGAFESIITGLIR
jgi:CO dehydrogenase maturation factor